MQPGQSEYDSFLPGFSLVVVVTAAFPCLYQFVTALFCLAAALAVLANCIPELALRIVDTLFALSLVTVVVKRLRGDRPGKKQGNDECCYKCFALLKHDTSCEVEAILSCSGSGG
jgi:hypothetical protein